MPFYNIHIQKNLKKDEIMTKKGVQLDLNDIQITPTNQKGGRNNVYQFKNGDYTFQWEQTEQGGIVEIYQQEQLIKEISY